MQKWVHCIEPGLHCLLNLSDAAHHVCRLQNDLKVQQRENDQLRKDTTALKSNLSGKERYFMVRLQPSDSWQ